MLMLATSFPVPTEQNFYSRKSILLKEFGWYADPDTPLKEFLYLSEVALARRERKIKAAKENKVLID